MTHNGKLLEASDSPLDREDPPVAKLLTMDDRKPEPPVPPPVSLRCVWERFSADARDRGKAGINQDLLAMATSPMMTAPTIMTGTNSETAEPGLLVSTLVFPTSEIL
jgi:hypothetical protein